MKNKGLSVVLATFNEEENIADCLESIKKIADEIIIVDGSSKDKTREIAKNFDAKVFKVKNEPIFHINKQKALEKAEYQWVLQLDADEIVTKELADEIIKVIKLSDADIAEYQENFKDKSLFDRHQELVEKRDGKIGKDEGQYAGFFVPRLNYFLGKYLRYGGVYPDGVIRLVKNGNAYFPAKDVHEQIVVNGRVGWLQSPLIHMADPTFKRYIMRNNRYINLITKELREQGLKKNINTFLSYMVIKPINWFFGTLLRHKGILDGYQGIIFSFFSALRFPRAYWRYLQSNTTNEK